MLVGGVKQDFHDSISVIMEGRKIMNDDNLHEIINRYEKDLAVIYVGPHYG